MKTLVLHLPKNTNRRADMERKLADAPFLQAEFVEGICGADLSEAQRREIFDYERFYKRRKQYPTDGEVGCALGHLKIWEIAAQETEPLLVIEDDAIFSPQLSEALKLAKKWLNTDEPRVMLLGGQFFYFCHIKSQSDFQIANPIQPWGTFCYAINPAGGRLLSSMGKAHYVADDWSYFKRIGLNIKAITPSAAHADKEYSSDVTYSIYNPNWPIYRKLKHIAPIFFARFINFIGILKEQRSE